MATELTLTQAVAVSPELPQELPQEPAQDGATDDEIIARAQKLRRLGNSRKQIKAALLEEYFGIEDDVDDLIGEAYDREIEEAYKAEDEARQSVGKIADERNQAQAEADNLLVKQYGNTVLLGQINQVVDPEDKQRVEKAAQIIKRLEAEQDKEEDFDSKQEPFPEMPILPGLLTDLSKVSYPSIPIEFKQMCYITRFGLLRSGIDRLQWEPHLQPRFYIVMVTEPNRGKTAANNETKKDINEIFKIAEQQVAAQNNLRPTARVFGDFTIVQSIDSGPYLAAKFHELSLEVKKQVAAGITTDTAVRIMHDPDEIRDTFSKMKSTNSHNSTLSGEILKLHSGNKIGNGTKKDGDLTTENAHFAMLGGVPINEYGPLWTATGGASSGLTSRIIPVTTNAPPFPAVPVPSDIAAVLSLYQRLAKILMMPGQSIEFSREASDMLVKWYESIDKTNKHTIRVLETIKQLLIVLAVTNVPESHSGTSLTVGVDLMGPAIEFGKYVIAVRERLNPADSWNNVQAMENMIIDYFKKHANRNNPKTRTECRRGIQPQRRPGGLGSFQFAWDNCVKTGVLKVRDKTQRDNRYSL